MVIAGQLDHFVINMFFLVGILIALGILFVFAVAAWTGIRMITCTVRRVRAEKAWEKASRRADGKPYPPSIEGVCDLCRRGNRHIYYPPEATKGLCPGCYEVFWRQMEGYDISGFSAAASFPTDLRDPGRAPTGTSG